MNDKINIGVYSEIGKLETVILHTPGAEVENMSPLNAERALYSDILNLSVTTKEYTQFSSLLGKFTNCLFVEDLLSEVCKNDSYREALIKKICVNEHVPGIIDDLLKISSVELAQQLIRGVPLKRGSLTSFLNKENFSLRPLHNFFFTRDASVSIYDKILISKMASKIRYRESLIMQAIFEQHPVFKTPIWNPVEFPDYTDKIKIEGGDILIAREDIIIAGIGARTSSQGIDFLLERFKEFNDERHIIVQELPHEPESFIHLDMAFSFLDNDSCLIYEPLILKPNKYATVHLHIQKGKIRKIEYVKNIPDILHKLGMDMKTVYCGGRKDQLAQEREQWHSGANIFAIAPGKLIGYGRNVHTLEDLNDHGFEILKATDVIDEKVNPDNHSKFIITMDGSELARGGGGARCMTMPVKRAIAYQ